MLEPLLVTWTVDAWFTTPVVGDSVARRVVTFVPVEDGGVSVPDVDVLHVVSALFAG